MFILRWIVYLSLAFGTCGVRADADLEDSHYTTGPPNRDGIGKIYMGREISHVMGHLGAGWLERPERERQERTDLLIAGLSLSEDFVVQTSAPGRLFHLSGRDAEPQGKVFAVDIQPEMLALMEQRKALEKVDNVKTVWARRMTLNYRTMRLTWLLSWMRTTSSRFLERWANV